MRTTRGKNEAHRTRRAGQIPAIVYGAFQDPVAVAVDPREIVRILHSGTGYNTIFDLAIEGGGTTPVLVVDQQVDPIKGTLLHADFKRIDLTKRLKVAVPVITEGEPMGVKQQGGLLEIITRTIEIECLPDEIPERFVVDVSELMLGQNKRASDVQLSGSARLVSSPDAVVAHVVAPRAEEEEEKPAEGAVPAAEGAAPAAGSEPEVAKKGKKEEEGAAEEKGKKK
jgi:large subunit ribosomal protein L25